MYCQHQNIFNTPPAVLCGQTESLPQFPASLGKPANSRKNNAFSDRLAFRPGSEETTFIRSSLNIIPPSIIDDSPSLKLCNCRNWMRSATGFVLEYSFQRTSHIFLAFSCPSISSSLESLIQCSRAYR